MTIRKENTPIGPQRAGGEIGITLLAAWALLAWAPAPARAHVIDDFEHGQKFMYWGDGGQPETDFADGQLRLRLPTRNSFASGLYRQYIFELPAGQPVQFNLDLVSANGSDVYGGLFVEFAQETPLKPTDRQYAVFALHSRVMMLKGWDGVQTVYFDESVTWSTAPKTLSLTLTRQGRDVQVAATVALRDEPHTVFFSRTVTDRPTAADGPLVFVGFEGYCKDSTPGAEITVDNLTCSAEPAPHRLRMTGTGATERTLEWPGSDIALEADSLQGPWRPCPEPVTLGNAGYLCTVPLGGSARYFRTVMGYHASDSFEGGTQWAWKTTSVVPGGPLPPAWNCYTAQGRGRILGPATRNQDFMLRWGAGIWYRDCVSTVDIADWGNDMADATFGILLRAKPETELWYSTTDGLPEQRYAGLLTFKKADNPNESALSITGPGGALLKEQRFGAVNPDKEYRLRFWAVGDQLTLELFDLADPGTPIQAVTVMDGQVPEGMDGLYGTKSAGGTYEVWIGQFMFTGATVR